MVEAEAVSGMDDFRNDLRREGSRRAAHYVRSLIRTLEECNYTMREESKL
jgi:hypothetical protein